MPGTKKPTQHTKSNRERKRNGHRKEMQDCKDSRDRDARSRFQNRSRLSVFMGSAAIIARFRRTVNDFDDGSKRRRCSILRILDQRMKANDCKKKRAASLRPPPPAFPRRAHARACETPFMSATSYPPTGFPRSTFGDGGLNCRVRNGIG